MATGRITAPKALKVAHWTAFARASRPLDVVGPRGDGSFVLAAHGRLWLLTRAGDVRTFPIAGGGYQSVGGEEPYIALAPAGCFGAGNIYAIRLVSGRGIVAISAADGVRGFVRLLSPGLIDGIAFDHTGDFAHRLLVTIDAGARTTLQAIDCRGVVTTITRSAPRVEGGSRSRLLRSAASPAI